MSCRHALLSSALPSCVRVLGIPIPIPNTAFLTPVSICHGQDLISQLLIRDASKRLGSKAGAEEIKAHPFFKGINWALLRNTVPPYVPRVSESDRPNPPAAAQAIFDAF
jgi:hypothetical protein